MMIKHNYRTPEFHYKYTCKTCNTDYIWYEGRSCKKWSFIYEFEKLVF